MERAGLYIHIPFCIQKCLYCDFLSFSGHFDYVEQYVEQVCAEIEAKQEWGKKLEFDTIFIGGGTPSAINPEWIDQILRKTKSVFPFAGDTEISIETNPGTITPEILKCYRDMGINRISMGVQSTSNRLLRSMGRIHSKEDAWQAATSISRHFTNRNIDLISGIPGINGESPQAWEELQEDLAFINTMDFPHVSVYSMITEPGTPLYSLTQEGKVLSCDEDLERRMYHEIRKQLINHGFIHYEISNFARPGHLCKHNMKYWQGKPYLGVGLGSASFLPRENEIYIRTTNLTDFKAYLKQQNFIFSESISISPDDRKKEYMMLGFRLVNGPDAHLYETLFGGRMMEDFRQELDILYAKGLIQDNYALTVKGMDYANEIFREFV